MSNIVRIADPYSTRLDAACIVIRRVAPFGAGKRYSDAERIAYRLGSFGYALRSFTRF
ncbi:MAG: hypothetical protein V2I33_23720 [Kangiellaceae bacterium]|nr:hypothetical protein [Kangiellaceae bacterium]